MYVYVATNDTLSDLLQLKESLSSNRLVSGIYLFVLSCNPRGWGS